MAVGEGVAGRRFGLELADGEFGSVGGDCHQEVGGCAGNESVDKVIAGGDFPETEAEVKGGSEIMDVVVEVVVMIATHFREIGANALF